MLSVTRKTIYSKRNNEAGDSSWLFIMWGAAIGMVVVAMFIINGTGVSDEAWAQVISEAKDSGMTITQDKPGVIKHEKISIDLYDTDGNLLSGLAIIDDETRNIEVFVKDGSKFVPIEKYAASEDNK